MGKLGIPSLDYGAGLVHKLYDQPVVILPIRDKMAPTDPKMIDCQTGHIEDENLVSAQIREGTEETIIIREYDDDIQLGVPNMIKNTEFERDLKHYYEVARCDNSSPLPEYDSTFYYECDISTPDRLPTKSINENYDTGYTLNFAEEKVTEELINQLTIGIEIDDLVSGNYSVYDIENTTYPEYRHFDRPVLLLNYKTGKSHIFKSGDILETFNILDVEDFLQRELGWDIKEQIATYKVQSILYCLESNRSIKREIVDDRYLEKLSKVGKAMI